MAEIIYLKWNDYSTTLLGSLQRFHNKEQLCDSTLVCRETFYPVHRLILSLCSEHFESIYEKATCKHPFVIISDIEPIHLKAILDFMYHGHVEIHENILPHFLKAAKALKIKGLTYYDLNTQYPTTKDVQHHKAKKIVESSMSQTNDSNGILRSPLVLDPILSVQILDDYINLNNVSYPLPPNEEASKKLSASEKVKMYEKKQYLSHKNLRRTDNSEDGVVSQKVLNKTNKNNYSFRDHPLGDYLEHVGKDDYPATQFTESTEANQVLLSNSILCISNLRQNVQTPVITNNFFSGVCKEEFETNHNATDAQSDDVEIKEEFTEFSLDENDCFERSSSISVKSKCLLNEEYSNPTGIDVISAGTKVIVPSLFDTDAKVLENGFQEVLSTSQALKIDNEGENSETNSDSFESLNERKLFFLSIGLKESAPGLGDKLQNSSGNCSLGLSKYDKHKCSLCPYVSTKRILRLHESAHASSISYKCEFCWYIAVLKADTVKHQEYCSKLLKNKENIKMPLISKHSDNKCNFCSYSSKHAGHFKIHQRIHSDKKLKCNKCSFTSVFKNVMIKHKLSQHKKVSCITHGIEIFQCQECPFSSKLKASLSNHEKCHSSNQYYKCKICSYSSANKLFTVRHELLHLTFKIKTPLKVLQNTSVNSTSTKKMYKCRYRQCKFSTVFKKVLSRHKMIHTKIKLIEPLKDSCEAKSLRKRLELNTLRNKPIPVTRNKMYICRFCPYASDLNAAVMKHETQHKIRKRHKCSQCSFSSDYFGRVKNHEMLHNIKTEKLQFQTPINSLLCPYCSYVSANGAYHKQHLMKHTGEKPFACDRPTCDYRANFRSNLQKHQRSCPAS